MKKTLLFSIFAALFMFAAINFQNGVVEMNVSTALAGDHDSGSSDSNNDDDDSGSSDSNNDDESSHSGNDDDDNVAVCHASGNSGNAQTKYLDGSDLIAHLGHGDSLGECEDDVVASSGNCECPPGIAACTCADGGVGTPSSLMPTAAGPVQHRSY